MHGDLNSFIVYAMRLKFIVELAYLWKVGVLTLVWALWEERNHCVFNGDKACSFCVLAGVLVACREANTLHSLGSMHNSWSNLVVLNKLAWRVTPPRRGGLLPLGG